MSARSSPSLLVPRQYQYQYEYQHQYQYHSKPFVVAPASSGPQPAVRNSNSTTPASRSTPAPAPAPVVMSPPNNNAPPPVPLAHKHAHHLHTIPPRQKSTRTLILDHMLWLHARTRFSQVRAELGLADLDTDEDAFWVSPGNGNGNDNGDGHFVQLSRRDALMESLRYGRYGRARSFMEVGVEEMSRADHVQARALRQKADGLEKVLTAIMDQCFEPPPSQCPRPRSMHLDLLISSTSSPSSRDRSSNVQSGLSVLPNGVRVRLAVGALINILFSRRVDDPLSLPSTASVTRANSSINVSSLPASLIPLCLDATESADPSAQAQFVGNGPTPTTLTIFNLNDPFFQPLDVAAWAHHAAESSTDGSSPTEPPTPPRASGRSKDLYACGAQSPTSLSLLPESIHHSVRSPIRCTRHLAIGCATCPVQLSSATSIGSGLSRRPNGSPFRKIAPEVKSANGNQKSIDLPHSHPSSSTPRSRLVDLIPQFLQLSALVAVELAIESTTSQPCAKVTSTHNSITTAEPSESESPHLSDSGYHAIDSLEGSSSSDSRAISRDGDPPLTPKKERRRTFPFSSLTGPGAARTSYQEPESPFSSQISIAPVSAVPHYQRRAGPTREWYALLAGLLTRAVLEGYLLKGWKGASAAETLLSLGLSDHFRREKSSEKKASIFELVGGEFPIINELDPDGLPSVLEAGRILFGEHGAMVKETSQSVEPTAEEEFAFEMHERMNEFLSIPPDTPSLTAHLETLSQKYAAEPVEHAALRFLESVETWRGNPELEMYKPNATSQFSAHSRTSSPPVLSPSPRLASLPQGTSLGAGKGPKPCDSMASVATPSRERSLSPTPPGAPSILPADTQFQAINQYFTVCLSKSKTPSPKPPASVKQPKSGAGERWSVFSLGSKRPRDVADGQNAGESTNQVEEEHSSKKINTARTA